MPKENMQASSWVAEGIIGIPQSAVVQTRKNSVDLVHRDDFAVVVLRIVLAMLLVVRSSQRSHSLVVCVQQLQARNGRCQQTS